MTKAQTLPLVGAVRERVIDTSLELVAERGWRETSVADVIAASGVTDGEFYREFDGLASVMVAASRRLNAAMMDARTDFEPEDSIRDRLFALIMAHFDAARPWKPAIFAMARSVPADPVLAATAGQALMALSARALDVAGVETSGPLGFARTNAFMMGVVLPVARVWLRDDSEDLAKTMAALDDSLARAEDIALRVKPLAGERQDGLAAAPGQL